MKVVTVEIGKQGISAKTGKKWLNYKITLEDGRKAGGFDPVRVGDEVTVTQNGEYLNYKVVEAGQSYPDEPPDMPASAPQSSVARSNGGDGVGDARKHLMQSCNLLSLCVDAVEKAVAPYVPAVAQTPEFFQAQVATLFIESSRAGFVSKMPTTPIKKSATRGEAQEERTVNDDIHGEMPY